MDSASRDALLRIYQADRMWARRGERRESFHLYYAGAGEPATVEHPAWDPSWAHVDHQTIDDLEEEDYLRVTRAEGKRRVFDLSVAGRRKAEELERLRWPPSSSTGSGAAPSVASVLDWLRRVEQEEPQCFHLASRLLDRAVTEEFIAPDDRGELARRIINLVDEDYLRGAVYDDDQSTDEQRLLRTGRLELTMKAHTVPAHLNFSISGPPLQSGGGGTGGPVTSDVRDVFLSHASEDKAGFVRPLAEALQVAGVSVWYDEFELQLGDRLSERIDHGLATSRFGVVVLSKSFFSKPWPKEELAGLRSRARAAPATVILPVWHGVTEADVRDASPPLADLLAVSSSEGIDSVVEAIVKVVRRRRGQEVLSGHAMTAATVAEESASPDELEAEWLLDFDVSQLADFSPDRAHAALARHPEAYTSQLVMAHWMEGWRERMATQEWNSDEAAEAFDYAVRELMAHLRQGDFLPDGVFFRDAVQQVPERAHPE